MDRSTPVVGGPQSTKHDESVSLNSRLPSASERLVPRLVITPQSIPEDRDLVARFSPVLEDGTTIPTYFTNPYTDRILGAHAKARRANAKRKEIKAVDHRETMAYPTMPRIAITFQKQYNAASFARYISGLPLQPEPPPRPKVCQHIHHLITQPKQPPKMIPRPLPCRNRPQTVRFDFPKLVGADRLPSGEGSSTHRGLSSHSAKRWWPHQNSSGRVGNTVGSPVPVPTTRTLEGSQMARDLTLRGSTLSSIKSTYSRTVNKLTLASLMEESTTSMSPYI